MLIEHAMKPKGSLGIQVIRGGAAPKIEDLGLVPEPPPPPYDWPLVIDDRLRLDVKTLRAFCLPQRGLPDVVNEWRTRNLRNVWRGARRALAAKAIGVPTHFGSLFLAHWDGAHEELTPLGLVSLRVVTDAGVAFIADAFTNTVEAELMNFHGMGTGTTAEAAADTALVTELTTEYTPNSTRATGVQTSPTNVYQTVGTNTIDSGTPAVTEHGVFSQAATGGGTLLDRSKLAALNLVSGDGIQFTYQLTLTSGG
jgi:hypothetical protein